MPLCYSDTVPEDRVFSVLLGTFLHDVELRNITFSTGVLTVEECHARGFTVQEHSFPNGTKGFSLQVPFDADVVLKHVCELTTCVKCHSSIYSDLTDLLYFWHLQNPEPLVTVYFLPLIFGFIILPEDTPFAHPVDLQASLQDVGKIMTFIHPSRNYRKQSFVVKWLMHSSLLLVLPTITGNCDQNNFYISVKFGSQGSNFQAMVGPQQLTPELAQAYNYQENSTHCTVIVPYTAMGTAFEVCRTAKS